MKMKFYKNYTNPPKRVDKSIKDKGITTPFPEMTLRQMVDRYIRTGEMPETQIHEGEYNEEEAQPRNFDLSDITESQEVIALHERLAIEREAKTSNKESAGNASNESDEGANNASVRQDSDS